MLDNIETVINRQINSKPLTVDDITAKAINASFCMTSCSEDTISTIGARPPNFIICSPISVVGKENRKEAKCK